MICCFMRRSTHSWPVRDLNPLPSNQSAPDCATTGINNKIDPLQFRIRQSKNIFVEAEALQLLTWNKIVSWKSDQWKGRELRGM